MYNMCRINSLLVSDVSLPWFTKGLYDWSLRQTIKNSFKTMTGWVKILKQESNKVWLLNTSKNIYKVKAQMNNYFLQHSGKCGDSE